MKRFFIIYFGLFSSLFLMANGAYATPILNPDNNHYYEVLEISFTGNWFDAQAAAQSRYFMGMQGHLATITKQSENDFIQDSLASLSAAGGAFIGGFQNINNPSYIEPEGGWEWITGEPFVYTNWDANEPNNIFGDNPNEDGLEFLFSTGFWNDLPRTSIHPNAIVEYSDSVPVPEPSTIFLLGSGLIVIAGYTRKKLKR